MGFPVDDKSQVSADVLLGEVMNALGRIVGYSEVDTPFVPGLGCTGADDIGGRHERSPRDQDRRRVVQSDGLTGIRLRIRHRAHLDDGAWRACVTPCVARQT